MTHPATLLKNAWHAYGHHFRAWLAFTAPLAVVSGLGLVAYSSFSVQEYFGLDRLPGIAALAIVLAFIAALAAGWQTFINAAVIRAASVAAGRPIDALTAYSRGWRLCWSALWVSILRSLIILAGLLLFVVPGVIWAGRYAFAVQCVLLEDKRGLSAFRRSRELVSGRLAESLVDFGVIGLALGYGTWIAAIAVALAVAILSSLAGAIAGSHQPAVNAVFQIIGALGEIAAVWVALPFVPILANAVYRDFRENR